MKIFLAIFIGLIFSLSIKTNSLAHEQYVLTQEQLDKGFLNNSYNVVDSLRSPENLLIGSIVLIGFAVILTLNFFFQYSKAGKIIDNKLKKLEMLGHFLIRISLAISLLASAFYNSYLGPEIPIISLKFPALTVPALYIIGMLLLLGLFTRLASFIGILILIAATIYYGDYMVTYFNYFGEYLALLFFGSYYLSLDNKFFGIPKIIQRFKNWELLLIRVAFGITLLYPAITITLLHPAVFIEIYSKYELGKIWWLFSPDALFASLGIGLLQFFVGLMVITGFQTRLASLVTFFLYLGSILFFKEVVWPHMVLLALALYFVINDGGNYTINRLIEKRYFMKKSKKK